MKNNDVLKSIAVVVGLVILFSFIIGLGVGSMALVAVGIQYVALSFFAKQLAFWPCFVALLVLGAVAGIIRGSGK